MNETDPEFYREYLNLIGRSQLDHQLTAKVDVSGVVQVTLLEAHRERSDWESLADSDRLAWLQRVFANNLLDEIRRFRGQKRDFTRERSLEQSIDRSASRLQEWLASEQTSPSSKASANERTVALANALGRLPPAQATAIESHHLQGQSLKQVAANMDKSEGAVAAHLSRHASAEGTHERSRQRRIMNDDQLGEFLDDPDFQAVLAECYLSLQQGQSVDQERLAKEYPPFASAHRDADRRPRIPPTVCR